MARKIHLSSGIGALPFDGLDLAFAKLVVEDIHARSDAMIWRGFLDRHRRAFECV